MQSPSPSEPQSGSSGRSVSRRILPIDATRGLIMQFSCLAHFAWWIHPAYPNASDRLIAIGMIATPTFVLISGAMVAFLSATAGARQGALRGQLFNRGLFLMTVGHLLITLAEAHQAGGLAKTVGTASVVDDIGLCTVLCAFILRYVADPVACRRLAWGAVIGLLAIWLLVLFWHPSFWGMTALKQILIGGDVEGRRLLLYTSPTLQYLLLYALGFPIGHMLAAARSGGSEWAMAWLLRVGLALVIAACLARFAYIMVPHAAAGGPLDMSLRATVKSPPSPVYLAFYAGWGLLLAGGMFWLHRRASRASERVVQWFATIGRASLFVFILQYFLYWTLPDLLGIRPGPWAALFFASNVLLIWLAAAFWNRIGGNRWMRFNFRLPEPRMTVTTSPS